MVNITKRVHFYLKCRADIGKRIEQEMRTMLVGIYHTEYFDASERLRKLTGGQSLVNSNHVYEFYLTVHVPRTSSIN